MVEYFSSIAFAWITRFDNVYYSALLTPMIDYE